MRRTLWRPLHLARSHHPEGLKYASRRLAWAKHLHRCLAAFRREDRLPHEPIENPCHLRPGYRLSSKIKARQRIQNTLPSLAHLVSAAAQIPRPERCLEHTANVIRPHRKALPRVSPDRKSRAPKPAQPSSQLRQPCAMFRILVDHKQNLVDRRLWQQPNLTLQSPHQHAARRPLRMMPSKPGPQQQPLDKDQRVWSTHPRQHLHRCPDQRLRRERPPQ